MIFSLNDFIPNPGLTRKARLLIHPKPAGSSTAAQFGYSPEQIRIAYGLSKLSVTGVGQTIAIIDAYGCPRILNNLAVFCQRFGLSPANLTIAYPEGRTKTDLGWATETSLDVEWVHAIAPDAKILLVVAKSDLLEDFLTAIDYATSHGAQVVSNSWGVDEFFSESRYESHFQHPGVVYVAASGDDGAGVEWPAVSPNVLAVGGTSLVISAQNSYRSESGWSDSGGGVSRYLPMPSYQSNLSGMGGSHRRVPDVAFEADPRTGVPVYDGTKYQGDAGWFQAGGTSLAAPIWAAMLALVDQGRTPPLTSFNALTDLYSLAAMTGKTGYAANFHDIARGNNGYRAKKGYDLVTGLGSPKCNNLIPNLTGLGS